MNPERDEYGLTVVEREYVNAYLTNGYNATRAYMASHPNASYNTAYKTGYTFLHKPHIKAELDRLKKEIYEQYDISAEHIASELASMAFGSNPEIKPADKMKAIDLLQKQFGLQTKNMNVDAEVGARVQIVEDYGEEC